MLCDEHERAWYKNIWTYYSRQWVLWLSWDCITKQVLNPKQKAHIVKSRRELKMRQVLCCQREMLRALLSVSTLVWGCSSKMVRFSTLLHDYIPEVFFSTLVLLVPTFKSMNNIVEINTFITLKVIK